MSDHDEVFSRMPDTQSITHILCSMTTLHIENVLSTFGEIGRPKSISPDLEA